jgi:diguanylate cyclase (GGDEF)-like protein
MLIPHNSPRIYSLYRIHVKPDNTTYNQPAGNFYIYDGCLEITHDPFDFLARYFGGSGKTNTKILKKFNDLKNKSYYSLVEEGPSGDIMKGKRKDLIPELNPSNASGGDVSNETGDQGNIDNPPDVFHYHRTGMDAPQLLEIVGESALLNGSPLTEEEIGRIMENARSGVASIRWPNPPQDLPGNNAAVTSGEEPELDNTNDIGGLNKSELKKSAQKFMHSTVFDKPDLKIHPDWPKEMLPSVLGKLSGEHERAFRAHENASLEAEFSAMKLTPTIGPEEQHHHTMANEHNYHQQVIQKALHSLPAEDNGIKYYGNSNPKDIEFNQAFHNENQDIPIPIKVGGNHPLDQGLNPVKCPHCVKVLENPPQALAEPDWRPNHSIPEDYYASEKLIQGFEALMKEEQKYSVSPQEHEDAARTAQHFSKLDEAAKSGLIPQETVDHMRKLAYTDPLTGLGNKLAYKHHLASNPGGTHIMLDANDFKPINEEIGHEAGDKAIGVMGQAIKGAMDDTQRSMPVQGQDTAGKAHRFGGDEFHLTLPSPEHAALFSRHLRSRLEATPPINGTHHIGMSLGIGQDPRSADAALDTAKKTLKAPELERMAGRKLGNGERPFDANGKAIRAPGHLYAVSNHPAMPGIVPGSNGMPPIGAIPPPEGSHEKAPIAPIPKPEPKPVQNQATPQPNPV